MGSVYQMGLQIIPYSYYVDPEMNVSIPSACRHKQGIIGIIFLSGTQIVGEKNCWCPFLVDYVSE